MTAVTTMTIAAPAKLPLFRTVGQAYVLWVRNFSDLIRICWFLDVADGAGSGRFGIGWQVGALCRDVSGGLPRRPNVCRPEPGAHSAYRY